ncbi:MAG: sterol desaturase family protein [Pirellulales bacterium]
MSKLRQAVRDELEAPPALRAFGSGWISGVLGLILGVGGLLLVISLRLPGVFAMAELRAYHEAWWFRLIIHALLLGGFACAALSLALRRGKLLGTCGVVAVLAAVVLGGSRAEALNADPTPLFLGLDWFVLNVLFTGMLFVPIERLFPHDPEQPLFREEWREDIFYYLVSSMLVQLLTYVTLAPARTLTAVTSLDELRAWVAAMPFVVQFLAIMVLTDFVQYWVHRMFHRLPWLWRFHAVHHSAKRMDWMAGADARLRNHGAPRVDRRADDFSWLRRVGGPGVHSDGLHLLDAGSCESVVAAPADRSDSGHAAISSLASWHRTRSDRRELRRALSDLRPPVRHVLSARG